MPDKIHPDVAPGVKILLKAEQDQHFVHIFLDLFDAVGFPCPDLGTDIIDDLDIALFDFFGQS